MYQLERDAQDRRLWRETVDGLCSQEGVKGKLLLNNKYCKRKHIRVAGGVTELLSTFSIKKRKQNPQ